MMERIPAPEQPKIIDTLEIAAGNFSLVHEMNRVAREAGQHINLGENVVVSDLWPAGLIDEREGLQRGTGARSAYPIGEMRVVIDNARMPFPNGSVRRVVCANFFSSEDHMETGHQNRGESFENAKRYIEEIRRVLVPGGILFIHDSMSPEVSDYIFNAGLFVDGFDEVLLEEEKEVSLTENMIGEIRNRFGEKGVRGMKIFRKK